MVSDDAVKKLAALARLAISEDEVKRLAPELSRIVAYVDELASVDVRGVEPLIHGSEAVAVSSATRPDEQAQVLGRAAINQSAGFDDDDGLVRVPRVVE